MFVRGSTWTVLAAALLASSLAAPAAAKDKVKVGFIGPLTGGVSVNGLGGRNSADLAVRLRYADVECEVWDGAVLDAVERFDAPDVDVLVNYTVFAETVRSLGRYE